jgi:hypothetical protein
MYNLAIQAFFAPASLKAVALAALLTFSSRTATDKQPKNGCQSQYQRDMTRVF